ncbi:MAG: hypothetical protein Q7S16_01450 [bacterium]|nr:hypothetical protein [bacterium]
MDEQGSSAQPKPTKGVVLAIFLLAIFAAIFGVMRFRQQLYAQKNENKRRVTLAKEQEQQSLSSAMNETLALQQKDTDGDGLSDYDELNRYKTSPYLKDSDSDTFDDNAEIASGNDPNCPKGQDCAIADMTSKTTLGVDPTPSVMQGIVPNSLIAPPLAPPLKATAELAGRGGGTSALPPFSPDTARAMLKQAGLTDDQIQQFDDATLKEMYDEAVAKTSPTLGVGATPSVYTPAQIREILKANGISEQMLQGVDDATLQKIFEEAMKGQQ